jgi:DNA-binding transcriptional LysR family regulator
VWQTIREELHPRGFELVTVALDTGGAPAARPWIKRARPRHPSLIDQAHTVDALLGIVNVPSGVWIDEQGTLVRPPETAYPRRPEFLDRAPKADDPPHVRERVALVKQLRIDAERYVRALRDWVAHGSASRYALSPTAVVERSRPRSVDDATAAAHFELGQQLVRMGRGAGAVPHFRAAHALQPDNWTYKRQAWSLVDPTQGPTSFYEGDWLSDVRKIGAENYYPALEMD